MKLKTSLKVAPLPSVNIGRYTVRLSGLDDSRGEILKKKSCHSSCNKLRQNSINDVWIGGIFPFFSRNILLRFGRNSCLIRIKVLASARTSETHQRNRDFPWIFLLSNRKESQVPIHKQSASARADSLPDNRYFHGNFYKRTSSNKTRSQIFSLWVELSK